MLNRIVLSDVRRIVSNPSLKAQLIDQSLQILFEQVVSRTIRATAITIEQDRSCLWIIESQANSPVS